MDKQLEETLLKASVLIHMCTKDGDFIYGGSGFFIKDNNQHIYLVSNYHVIEHSNYCNLYLTIQNIDTNKISDEFIFCELENHITKHAKYDLCIVDITHEYNDLLSKNIKPLISILEMDIIETDYDHYNHIENVYMIGYPGLRLNHSNNYPLVRKGITSTGLCDTIDTEHLEYFVVDIPMFGGSSGSPVYYIDNEHVKLVGIAVGGYSEKDFLYEKQTSNNKDSFTMSEDKYTKVHISLGIVIKSKILLELFNIHQNQSI